MHRLIKKLVIPLMIFNLSCAKNVETKKFEEGPIDFKPTTNDVQLDREKIASKTASDIFLRPAGSYYLQSSDEILEFAETLLDLATFEKNETKRNAFFSFSEKTRTAYYANSNNYSKFNEGNTPYLELALGLSYDSAPDANLKNMIFEGMDQEASKLAKSLSTLKLDLVPQKTLPNVALTIQAFEKFLLEIPQVLKQGEVEAEVVAKIESTLKEQYVPLLVKVEKQLSTLEIKKPVATNIEIVENAVKGFSLLPPSFTQPILAKILPIKNLGTKISTTKSADDLFDVFFDLWNNPLVNREDFKKSNEALYEFFNSMSVEQVSWLQDYNLSLIKKNKTLEDASWWSKALSYGDTVLPSGDKLMRMFSKRTVDPYVLTSKMWYAKRMIRKMGVEKIVNDLQGSLNQALLIELDGTLRGSSQVLVSTISEEILRSVGDAFLDVKNNLQNILRTEGASALKKMMFVEKPQFVAIEDARVALMLNKKRNLVTEINRNKGKINVPADVTLSGSKTLGLALSLQAKRLKKIDADGLIPKNSVRYYEEVFTPVNKMMAIVGYKYMESTKPRFPGLFRQINGRAGSHEMDIFKYDLETDYFSIPERILIHHDFTVDVEGTRNLGQMASVEGNAEVARGAANMMFYFRDWIENGYDEAMGKEQYQETKVFPKPDFFALSLGLGSVPLRNLTREGLIGYTLAGKKRESTSFNTPQDNTTESCPPPESGDPVTVAALTSVSPGGQGDFVKTADVARFILAADTFIDSVEGVTNSSAGPLQLTENGIRTNIKAIRCGRESLKGLMMGLGNFLVSKMQLPDGGFVHEYSLEQRKAVPDITMKIVATGGSTVNRYLEDQILAIQALRKVYDRWKGQAYANLAVDAYHFMNKNLFDVNLGFYKSTEKTVIDSKIDLRLMSMTLESLKMLEPIVPKDDRDQLQFLEETWSQKLQDFISLVQ